jgi:hypothetical protein
VLKQVEARAAVPDLCRENGISPPTFYKLRAKFGGMAASLMAPTLAYEALLIALRPTIKGRLM